MRISEAIERFNNWKSLNAKATTIRGYDLNLRQLAVFTRDDELENIKFDDVMEWFTLQKKLGWDHNSFLPKAMALRKFFEFYSKQGFKVVDPWLIPIPKKEYRIARVVDDENYRKLLEAIPENNDPRHIRNRAIIHLLWDTGARNGEICSLNVSDIQLENKKAIIETEKSQGARPVREIFWTEKTNEILKKWIEKRKYLENKMIIKDDDALFISICSGGVHDNSGKRFAIKGVGEMLRRYCNKAKISYVNAHAFRHHMGHQIVKKGGSNSDVSNILGHSSLQSSFVYTQMQNVELQKRYYQFMEN